MAEPINHNEANMALFCDYENVALGTRDANFGQFDIGLVIERLLDKGRIVVKKAYCDWARYEPAKRPLHEAAFELIEIPHVSYSGKNSADIRLVVDALDLCYTKSHIDLFVIISGDSDFSPLVNKLRENAKIVLGVGVKNSSSNLLIENCDDFIYYDDLIRDRSQRSKRTLKSTRSSIKEGARKRVGAPTTDGTDDSHREEAVDLVIRTAEALLRDRGERVWGSMVKQTLKRKRPNFSEAYHGYRTFNQLIEDAGARGLLEIQKDDRSGGYVILSFGPEA